MVFFFVDSGFEHKPLFAIFVLSEEPTKTNKSTAIDVFGEPEVNNDKKNCEFTCAQFSDELVKDLLKVKEHHHDCFKYDMGEESGHWVLRFYICNLFLLCLMKSLRL